MMKSRKKERKPAQCESACHREIWARYGRDVGEMWARCGRDMGEIWARYGGDMGRAVEGSGVLEAHDALAQAQRQRR